MFGAQQPPAHAPARTESPELQQARAKLAQLELLLKQGKTILQDLRAQANAATKERDDLRGQLDALRVKLESAVAEKAAVVAEKNGFVAATEEAVAAMEAAVAERETIVAAKDAAVAERETATIERDAAITHLEAAVAGIKEVTGERDEMSLLLSELRADRDRVADELKSTESRRMALEETLGAAAGDVEQLRADADRARALAREIVEIYKPTAS